MFCRQVSYACLSCAKRDFRTLEADLQDLAIVADEPSGFRICKRDRPVTTRLRQFEPGLSFIGSPSGCAGGEVRLSFGRDHDGPTVFMAEAVVIAPIIMAEAVVIAPIIVVFAATH